MTDARPPTRQLVTGWSGVWLTEAGRLLESRPVTPADRKDRMERRRVGAVIPEERQLLDASPVRPIAASDRRLSGEPGVVLRRAREGGSLPISLPSASELRPVLLEVAEEALRTAWDPSIHVQEAVRSLTDLEEVQNLVGERLVSWGGRDAADPVAADSAGAAAVVRDLLDRPAERASDHLPEEPGLVSARRRLAELFRSIAEVRAGLEHAIDETMPRRTPNLSSLLGPLLAARLVAHAGGLDRLARLPASTIQVLGAEKAFFEHLRGRAPPPRHGLLFLHPSIHSAPRRQRGRMARALAGKVAIAARIDREGGALRPALLEGFQHRVSEVRAAAKGRRRGSAPPLDGAPSDG